jgi:hypothetical protein
MNGIPLGPFERRCSCGGLVEDDRNSRCQKCLARMRWHRRRLLRTDWRRPPGRRGETRRP